jgi:hypothetical protein
MKKSDPSRSRAIAARLARVRHKEKSMLPPIVGTSIAPPSLSQRANIAWRKLLPWQKRGAFLLTGVAACYSAFPAFSIERETTDSVSPYSAEFLFTKRGWLPATVVSVDCEVTSHITGPAVKDLYINGSHLIQAVSKVVFSSFTRGCGIFAPGSRPMDKGKVK